MQPVSAMEAFLFEKVAAYECPGGNAEGPEGSQLHLSPDGQHLGIIEPSQHAVTIVPLADMQPCRFQASPVIIDGKAESSTCEVFTTGAWSSDGQQLIVAGLTGSLYLLTGSATPMKVWLSRGQRLPWARAGHRVSGLALVAPDTLLLVTNTAMLYTVPLRAPIEQWANLKPVRLQGVHVDVRGCGYLHTSRVLVLAGLGAEGSKCPGVCVSLWRWQDKGLSTMPFAWHGKPQVSKDRVASSTRAWSVSFSPSGHHVAVAPAPHRLVLVSLPDGSLASVHGNTPPGGVSLNTLMQSPCSVAWASDVSLAVATPSGTLGLAQLPTLINLLGLPNSGPEQCTPGCAVSVKNEGEDVGLLVLEPNTRPHCAWQLSVLARRTPEKLLAGLLARHEWADATRLCDVYGLDTDGVHRARWSSAVISEALVDECLAAMSDQQWVCEEVITSRCAAEAHTQRHLLSYALDVSDQQLARASELPSGDEARWWRRMRLVLLRHMDRLNLLLALHNGLYEPDAFAALRDAPLVEVAQAWAALGSVTALTTLLSAAPCTLGPHLLTLLNCLPETLDPRDYKHLLPRADGAAMALPSPTKAPGGAGAIDPALLSALDREPDWVESALTCRETANDGFSHLCEATECMAVIARGLEPHCMPPLPAEDVESWYCERAVHMDITSRQLPSAVALLELAVGRGAAKSGRVARMLRHAGQLLTALPALSTGHVGPDGPAWLMTLDRFAALQPLDQLRLIMHSSTEESLQADITERAAPFLLNQSSADARQLLVEFLSRELSSRPAWCALLVEHEAKRPRLVPDIMQLTQVACQACALSQTAESWAEMRDMLEHLQRAVEEAEAAATAAGDGAKRDACANAASSLRDALTWVESGALLSRHEVHMMVPELRHMDRAGAQAVVQRLLSRAERVGGRWSNSDWSALWSGLRQLQASVLGALTAQDVMHQYVAVLLRAGRLDLAKSYLNGSGSVPISPESCGALVVGAACELLAGASRVHDQDVARAQEILKLAPAGNEAARAELSLLEVLQRLDRQGVTLAPAQVKQFQARQAAGAGGDGLQLLAYLLEQGRPQRLASQLDLVLEVVALLQLDSTPEQTAQAKLMIAQACGSAGDWDVASGLLVGLVDEGIEACAPLAVQLCRSKAGRLMGGDTRARLLGFAALHADSEDLPALLDELLAAQTACMPQEVQETVGAEPDYHLRRALSQPDHMLPFPSYGDVPLALAALSAAPTPDAMQQLVTALVGESGSMSMARFATLQRGLLVGIHSLAIRALQLEGTFTAQLQQWQQLHPSALLQQAGGVQLSVPSAQAALQAAQGLAQTLQAASDGRAVRTAVPGAQPTDLLGGDPQQRSQALLQQACVAGQQAGGVSPDGTTGSISAASVASSQKLLDHALQLCKQYKVSVWAARLEFVCAAAHAAPQVPAELKQQLLGHWQQLLQPTTDEPEPAPLLLSVLSNTMWPTAPPTSTSHLSLLLALLLACLTAINPAPAATTLQRLTKLSDLLDKAGGALRGLSLRQILTPLLRNALGPMQMPDPPPVRIPSSSSSGRSSSSGEAGSGSSQAALISRRSASAGLDPHLPALITEAQAAVYAYSTQQTVGATGKLLKAMQAIFALPAGTAADSSEAAGQAKTLSSLPITLPYFCLMCKTCSTHSASGGSPVGGWDEQAWTGLRDACLAKVSPGQLRAWLDFTLLAGKQPLSAAVAGRLASAPLGPGLQLGIARDALQQLPECGQAGAQAGKPLPDVTVRLLQLYGRLKVQAALPSAHLPQQVHTELEASVSHACEEAVSSRAQGGTSACQLLQQAVQAQLAHGVPIREVIATATTSWPDVSLAAVACNACGYATDLTPTQLVAQEVNSRLSTLLSAFRQHKEDENVSTGTPVAGVAQGLRMLVQALAPGDVKAEADDASEGVMESVDAMRQSVMQAVEGGVNGLQAWQYSQPDAAALLQVHVSLVSGQAWPGWQTDAISGPTEGATQALSSRVLLAATLAHLARSWSPLPTIQPQDLESTRSAVTCFLQLVQEAQSLEQQQSLAELLDQVWGQGAALPAAPAGGDEQGSENSAEGVSPLHACWRAVLCRAAETQHHQMFTRVLGSQLLQSGTSKLITSQEARGLALDLGAMTGQDCTAPALALLVLVTSSTDAPDAELWTAVALLLQQHGQSLLLDAQPEVAHTLAVACLSRRLLLQQGLNAQARTFVEQALVSFALRECGDPAGALLLPCTVAQLCMGQRFAVAASLAARACRWTTALRALGGSLHFLEHFLASVAHGRKDHLPADTASPQPSHVLALNVSSWVSEATKAVRDGCTTHS